MERLNDEMLKQTIKYLEPNRDKETTLGAVSLKFLEELQEYRATGLQPEDIRTIIGICNKGPNHLKPEVPESDDFDMDAKIW